MPRPPPHTLVIRVLGVMLLTAATLKLYGSAADPVARTGVFSAPSLQFLLISYEVLLGIWLLTGIHSPAAWFAVLITFVAFSAVTLYQGWIGQASCGCFGVTVNPWYALGIDLAAVTALLIARPDLNPIWESGSRIARTCAAVFGGYLLLLGALIAFALFHHGSIDAALASLRNERLTVHPSLIDVGEGKPGETRQATLEVTNRADTPIRLIGGTADCSCTVIGDLPVSVPPGEMRAITINVYLPRSPGVFTRVAGLSIDDQGSFKKVAFRLAGQISNGSANDE